MTKTIKQNKQPSEPLVLGPTIPKTTLRKKVTNKPITEEVMLQKVVAKQLEEVLEDDDFDDEKLLDEDDIEEEMDEDEAFFNHVMLMDHFDIKTGGLFSKEEIFHVDLPKFLLDNATKNMVKIEDKSGLSIHFMSNKTNPDLAKRIFKAIKQGFKEFKFVFPGLNEEDPSSTWTLVGAKIAAVDFGDLSFLKRDEPRTVQCDISYETLLVDGESIFE